MGLKENVLRDAECEPLVDEEDRSIIRTSTHFKHLFAQAGFELIGEALQMGFPDSLFPVRMYMLRPLP